MCVCVCVCVCVRDLRLYSKRHSMLMFKRRVI